MADLSDEQLDAIRFEAGARQRGATDTVGAEGLPPLPKGKLMGSGVINGKRVELRMHDDDAMRAYALAALASRPAVDADGPWLVVDRNNADAVVGGPFVHEETAAYHRRTLEMNASDKRNERWNLWVVRQAARHPAQREGE